MMDKPDWELKAERFWSSWPARLTAAGRFVKLGKTEAWAWFRVQRPDDALFATIMQGVAAYAAAQDPRYYMDAFRWLRKERWRDEYQVREAHPSTPEPPKPKEVIQNTTLEQRRAIAMQNAKLAEKLKPKGIGHSQRVFEARRQANLNKLDLVNKLKKPPMKLTGEPVQADFESDPALQMDESERWEQG